MNPTLPGFQWFLYNILGVTGTQLPVTSEVVPYVFGIAMGQVLLLIQQVAPAEYTRAVYNLATDLLINYAPDQVNQTFFQDLRTKFHIANFRAGVVSSTSDESTSVSIEVVESLKNLTVMDLNNLKTPYGQTYIGISQQYGSIWGIS